MKAFYTFPKPNRRGETPLQFEVPPDSPPIRILFLRGLTKDMFTRYCALTYLSSAEGNKKVPKFKVEILENFGVFSPLKAGC